jgi:hypothetical protein
LRRRFKLFSRIARDPLKWVGVRRQSREIGCREREKHDEEGKWRQERRKSKQEGIIRD